MLLIDASCAVYAGKAPRRQRPACVASRERDDALENQHSCGGRSGSLVWFPVCSAMRLQSAIVFMSIQGQPPTKIAARRCPLPSHSRSTRRNRPASPGSLALTKGAKSTYKFRHMQCT